jgi:hypothetical protein
MIGPPCLDRLTRTAPPVWACPDRVPVWTGWDRGGGQGGTGWRDRVAGLGCPDRVGQGGWTGRDKGGCLDRVGQGWWAGWERGAGQGGRAGLSGQGRTGGVDRAGQGGLSGQGVTGGGGQGGKGWRDRVAGLGCLDRVGQGGWTGWDRGGCLDRVGQGWWAGEREIGRTADTKTHNKDTNPPSARRWHAFTKVAVQLQAPG